VSLRSRLAAGPSWLLVTAALLFAVSLFAAPLVAVQAEPEGAPRAGHNGPPVAEGSSGPARFAGAVYQAFDVESAVETITFADRFYRAPGNHGYNATLDRVRERLVAAGFGEREGFELDEIVKPLRSPAWTPRSGRLAVRLPGGEEVVLHEFSETTDADRVMLPINAPSADVEGRVVFEAGEVEAGTILVSRDALNDRRIAQLAKRGALAVLSSSLASFTVDPSGDEEHLDAIQFRTVSRSVRLPVAQISRRSQLELEELGASHPELRLSLQAEVEFEEGELRTLVARVLGDSRAGEAVAIASHAQEPGMGDNASGVAGLCEAAVALARCLDDGKLARPARTVVFLWGDEMRQSSIWLEESEREVVAGISADMLGQSIQRTGAICLLERAPDPGALDTLPPDVHTPWGAGSVDEEDLVPSGLSLIARTALVDVAQHVGGWATSENPWEGGSDHDVFLKRGIPGILLWHFTDFTYHTSLDRLGRLDPEELRRSAAAILSTALAVADLRRADLERLEASNELELELRVEAALTAARPDVAKRWREWCHGVDHWLTTTCVDAEQD